MGRMLSGVDAVGCLRRSPSRPSRRWAGRCCKRYAMRAHGVPCDEALGRETSLLDHIDSLNLWYVAEVP